MSVFARTDKKSDNKTNEATHPVATPQLSVAPVAKPSSTLATPPTSGSAHGSPGVSVISRALKITGQLESTEDIRIDGHVDGDVRGVSVTVGSGAKIKGTVYGNAVELAGTIEGKIEAQKVVLASSARMSGDVVHKDIRIESGAYISGHCRPEFGDREEKVPHFSSKPATTFTGPAAHSKSSDGGTS